MDDHRVPMNGMPTLDPSFADLNHFQRDLRPTDKLCFGHRRHTVRPQSSLHPHHRVIVHTTDNSSSSNSSCCSSNASTNSSFSITPSFLTTKSVASSLLSSMPTSSSSSSNRRRRRMLDTQPSHLLVGNRTCISGHSTLFSPLVILCVILCCMQRTVVPVEAHFATLLPPSTTTPVDPYGPLREKEICPSMDIRNLVNNLSQLEGCRVIEGFLHIVLMEQTDLTGVEFNNYTFPKLREITGYLVLYRVFGLRSIGQLFPNLAVVRGQMLFFDFALVVYELTQLQEIGLKSLTDIQRGSVLIEKNPNLCYADTIDWERIVRIGREHHVIQNNKKANECPKCSVGCPSAPDGRRLCWNNDDCQKVCDSISNTCGSCNLTQGGGAGGVSSGGKTVAGYCCNEECAGGCSGRESNECDVCKNVFYDGDCRSNCPPGLYLYLKRRCVTQAECISMPIPPEVLLERSDVTWKFYRGECILECPADFQEEKKYSSANASVSYFECVPCKGACPKICKGAFLNNIETVQKLRDCTTIDGDLEMQIKGGGSIIQELERNLGNIQEIRGKLKIVRCFPLLSLNFLKSLKTITGHASGLEVSGASRDPEDEYALIVQDNQNLQQLWNHNVTIHMKMSFHYNPKLCLNLIENLLNSSRPIGSTESLRFSETDVSPWSNGDKATCDEQVLNVTVVDRTSFSVLLSWNNFRATLTDARQLLGYIISYVEAPNRNVTFYDGRDACGGDGWNVNDVSANSNGANQSEFHIISSLKPYTQYAIYIETYTVAPQQTSKRVGARSPIIYEWTSPAEPDQPEDLRAFANSSSELVIAWKPPQKPNGIVKHYIVIGQWRRDDQDHIDKQDSCAGYSEVSSMVVNKTPADNQTSVFGNNARLQSMAGKNASDDGVNCCDCAGPKDKDKLQSKEKNRRYMIEFENFLQNKIYVKNKQAMMSRNKRQAEMPTELGAVDGTGSAHEFPDQSSSEVKTVENRTNTYHNGRLITFYQEVTDTTSYTVRGLRYYADYAISVHACHENFTLCSKHAVTSARTKQEDKADDIIDSFVQESNHTIRDGQRSVKIGWKEPEDPNGLIIKYQIEYRRQDIPNSKLERECVRRKAYIDGNRTKILDFQSPGNYCVQVRAFSMAGLGQPTKEMCFVIRETTSSPSSGTIAGIFVLVFFIFMVLAGVAVYYIMKSKKDKEDDLRNGIVSYNPDYHKYIPDAWEVARDNVVLIKELGQGSFGMVYEGLVRNVVPNQPEAKCAIKTVNEKASIPERIQFLNEASVMKEFNAHHVVKLLGVVSKAQPTLVVMELMANGDLKTYLRSHRPDCEENVKAGRRPPTLHGILKMAIEIADGMSYLADKKFVHRDLAARNCMVAEDLTVKIGDFGMTRDIYETDYYRKGGKGLLPVRWMAPESLRDGVFTSQCDVWSFGVVLWEMATLASQPYQGLANEEVLKYVMEGGVMERPENCPDRLYILMASCWHYHAKSRPTFLDIIEDLYPDVPTQFSNVSFYHSDAGVAARELLKAVYEQESQLLNDPTTPMNTQDLEMDTLVGQHPRRHNANYPFIGDDIIHIDDMEREDPEEPPPSTADDEGEDCDDDDEAAALDGHNHSLAEREDDTVEGDEDHVPVLFPHERRPYVLVRNPAGNSAATNGGSKSDSSKGTISLTSDDSKGSYVSNGSASGGNGYVMGVLQQRRHNSAEC